jgi:hypothetical protein
LQEVLEESCVEAELSKELAKSAIAGTIKDGLSVESDAVNSASGGCLHDRWREELAR